MNDERFAGRYPAHRPRDPRRRLLRRFANALLLLLAGAIWLAFFALLLIGVRMLAASLAASAAGGRM